MPIIKLQTRISASKEVVFDLSRSIDLHNCSTAHTNEGAIADRLFLKRYMTNLFSKRNEMIKGVAENGKWKELIG
ncbi:MAG: hypothetical protein MK086_07005 [Flavobacteriales bacterium]|nr:hypothetical protein [Flavobacteriales bacterium]